MPATIKSLSLRKGRYTTEQEPQTGPGKLMIQAFDVQEEAPVSIFEIPVSLPKVATSAQRAAADESFLEAAAGLAKFKHRTVVGIKDHFVESGRHYVVSEQVNGVDLASLVEGKEKPFSLDEVIAWADSLLEALNNLHTYRPQLVHGNVSPDNVIISADGFARLVLSGMLTGETQGVGSSFALGGGSLACYSPLEKLWDTLDVASQKVILGQYDESSERTLKQDLDGRSDIYSLGATLYQLTTGRRPQDALERSVEMIEGNSDPLLPPAALNTGVPVEVSDVIMKALELKREYRFDSAAIMRQVLKTALIRAKERDAEIPDSTAGGSRRASAHVDMISPGEAETVSGRAKPQPVPNSVAEIFEGVDLEDDLLGILFEASSAASATTDKGTSDGTPDRAEVAVSVPAKPNEVQEPAEATVGHFDASEGSLNADEAVSRDNKESEIKSVEPATNAAAASSSAASQPTQADFEIFTEPQASKSKLPAMIAAAVVFCVAAVGGWFFFTNSKGREPARVAESATPPQPVQEQPVQTAVQPEPQPEPQQIATETAVQAETASVDEVRSEPQRNSKTPPQAAKAKRPPVEAKPARQKKAVTVDDLINDN